MNSIRRTPAPASAGLSLMVSLPAWSGPIFLTGHDPDFHAQSSDGAQNLLRAGQGFAAALPRTVIVMPS